MLILLSNFYHIYNTTIFKYESKSCQIHSKPHAAECLLLGMVVIENHETTRINSASIFRRQSLTV